MINNKEDSLLCYFRDVVTSCGVLVVTHMQRSVWVCVGSGVGNAACHTDLCSVITQFEERWQSADLHLSCTGNKTHADISENVSWFLILTLWRVCVFNIHHCTGVYRRVLKLHIMLLFFFDDPFIVNNTVTFSFLLVWFCLNFCPFKCSSIFILHIFPSSTS